MVVPHVTQFCWCMGLEVGSKVIGCVHLCVSLTLMIICSLFAANAKEYIGTVEDAEDHLYSTWYTISLIVAIISVAHVLLAVTLLVSVYKRNTDGLRAWVWVMATLWLVSLVFDAVVVSMSGFSDSGSDIFLPFLQGLVLFGLIAYCIFSVNSYYLMLKSAEGMERPNKVDY